MAQDVNDFLEKYTPTKLSKEEVVERLTAEDNFHNIANIIKDAEPLTEQDHLILKKVKAVINSAQEWREIEAMCHASKHVCGNQRIIAEYVQDRFVEMLANTHDIGSLLQYVWLFCELPVAPAIKRIHEVLSNTNEFSVLRSWLDGLRDRIRAGHSFDKHGLVEVIRKRMILTIEREAPTVSDWHALSYMREVVLGQISSATDTEAVRVLRLVEQQMVECIPLQIEQPADWPRSHRELREMLTITEKCPGACEIDGKHPDERLLVLDKLPGRLKALKEANSYSPWTTAPLLYEDALKRTAVMRDVPELTILLDHIRDELVKIKDTECFMKVTAYVERSQVCPREIGEALLGRQREMLGSTLNWETFKAALKAVETKKQLREVGDHFAELVEESLACATWQETHQMLQGWWEIFLGSRTRPLNANHITDTIFERWYKLLPGKLKQTSDWFELMAIRQSVAGRFSWTNELTMTRGQLLQLERFSNRSIALIDFRIEQVYEMSIDQIQSEDDMPRWMHELIAHDLSGKEWPKLLSKERLINKLTEISQKND